MLGRLIQKEVLDHILSFRFLILSVLGGVTIWLSLFSGYEYYHDCLKDYRLAEILTERQIQETINSKRLAFWNDSYGITVQKPPTAMSIFVRGLDPVLGRTNFQGQILKYSPVAEEPTLGIFYALDLTVVVQFVLSLFALLLTCDSICGEKEGGTLSLVASFPVSKDRLLIGKIIGAQISVLVAFWLPALLGIALVFLLPDVQLQKAEWMRLGLIFIAFALYLVAFTCAGVMGSCLTRRTATSFVILLFFWAGTVAVLPRLSLIEAGMFRPAPSTQQFQANLRTSGRNHERWRFGRYGEVRREWAKKTGTSWQTPAGREYFAHGVYKVYKEAWKIRRAEIKSLELAFRNRYEARLDLAVLLARLSPAFALKNGTARLAGTGPDRHRRFHDAVILTRERTAGEWYPEIKKKVQLHNAYPEKYDPPDFSDLPQMQYQETWPDEDVQTAIVDMGWLALWGVFFFLGAYLRLLRYDFR